MLGTEASAALTGALLPVVVWCASCLVRRAGHGGHDPVPTDVEAWHAVMGVVMLLLLWWTASASWAWAGAGLFVAATTWCVMQARGHRGAGGYRRLGVMSVAMVVMLVPAGAAGAATSNAMAMPRSGQPWLSGPAALAVAAVLMVVALTAVRAAARPAPTRTRVVAGCDVVMAAAMVVTALAMV